MLPAAVVVISSEYEYRYMSTLSWREHNVSNPPRLSLIGSRIYANTCIPLDGEPEKCVYCCDIPVRSSKRVCLISVMLQTEANFPSTYPSGGCGAPSTTEVCSRHTPNRFAPAQSFSSALFALSYSYVTRVYIPGKNTSGRVFLCTVV